MSESVISLSEIHKSYGDKEVLCGVNLEIEKGVIYGLVGKNGSGKSTIFKVILGLTEYSSGELRVGEPGESLSAGRHRIGFLIGNNYFPYLTAEDNLRYYSILKGVRDKTAIDKVLKLVGLDGVKTKVGGYSLGMKQRLGIANALLGDPEILILDEPTNGLDPQGIADIRDLLKRINEESGMTIVISSHILGELQNTAQRFAILNNGVIVKVLSENDLKTDPKVIRLKVDDADKAMQVLKENGIDILSRDMEAQTLEHIYFSLIGGTGDA